MTRTFAAATLCALALASAAHAGDVVLHQPLQAGSLDEGNVDMVAYFIDGPDGALELTATFLARTSGAEPMRIVAPLQDGDALNFALPGQPLTTYSVARSGAEVRISAVPVSYRLALN